VPRITASRHRISHAPADDGEVLLLALTLATAWAVGAALLGRAARHRPPAVARRAVDRRPVGSWLSLPLAPRATTGDDDWVLEAFDPDEIAELRRIDTEVRGDLARDHHAAVLARVPDNRRDRRVRAIGWADGRLALVLGDRTELEFDGVSQATAVWLGYCHDQFGLVLEAINPADSSWAARLGSCGWDTPVRASRVRVS